MIKIEMRRSVNKLRSPILPGKLPKLRDVGGAHGSQKRWSMGS